MKVELKEPYKRELNKFIEQLKRVGFKVHNPEFDVSVDEIYGDIRNPIYQEPKFYLSAIGKIEFEIPSSMLLIDMTEEK